jgi:hypothetical protein
MGSSPYIDDLIAREFMKSSKKLTLGILPAALLWSVAPAMANLIFTTSGTFSGPNSSGSNLLFTDASGSATTSVSLAGAPSASLPIPGIYSNQNFGTFNVSTMNGPVGTEYLQPGNQLDVVIHQSNPAANPSSQSILSSLIQGTVVSSGGALFVDFAPGSDSVSFNGGAQKYTVNDVNPVLIDSTGSASVELQGTVEVTPSPSSAVGGVLFCVLLFLGRPRREPRV